MKPTADGMTDQWLREEISRLKKEKNALIMATITRATKYRK